MVLTAALVLTSLFAGFMFGVFVMSLASHRSYRRGQSDALTGHLFTSAKLDAPAVLSYNQWHAAKDISNVS